MRLLPIAEWTGLDVLADPFSGSTQGITTVTALMDVDIGIRHIEGFSAMVDADTA